MWNPRRGWVVVFAVWPTVSCVQHDDEAAFNTSLGTQPLAVNAFIPLSPVDGCSGGGKINLCSTESLVAIEEMSSRDPKIVEVVPAVDMPAKLSNDEFFARGASPGKTTIDFRGRFDDGSVRSATLDIEVASVTRLDIESRCTTEKNGVVLAAPGELASFEVLMYNQQRQLAGWHPSAIDSNDSLELKASSYGTHYNWRAPVEPGSTKLTSPLTPFSPGTLRVFGPADVTEIELAPLNSGIQWVTPGHDFFVKTALAVGDREPCDRLPLTFKTDTPAVCSGPEGELTWPMSRSTDGAVRAQREGVCKLRVSADGARYFGPLSLSLFDLNAPEGLVLPVVGEVCSGEGATTCEWGRDGTLVCASGKWKRATRCTATQACDLADGCLDGIDCGACRDLRP